ncbi:MAG: DNA mismatch repair protein MutS [Chlamydiales bacterium]|nr:DNA mismatch repair protein MutS [Chlamydiales bacterium]NCF70241.1 DNA mismatch repair protein MutS [Chlamydiales bacterium]
MLKNLPSAPQEKKTTPMMAQWHACKKIAKEAILLFRMGDFYEAFYDDAVLISEKINLTLTKRQGIPMCGVPYHSSDAYIDKLVALGLRVAIAEQTEDPKQAKGLVKREVVRIVTPGTTYSQQLVPDKSNNFLVSIDQVGSIFGLAVLDLSTAEFEVIEFEKSKDLLNEIFKIKPSELLCSEKFYQRNSDISIQLQQTLDFLLTTRDNYYYTHESSYANLQEHFAVHSLDSFGLKGKVAAINAAGALLYYLKKDLKLCVSHLKSIKSYQISDYMSLDYSTQKHLELTENTQDGSRKNTLLQVLDQTFTAMGGRLIQRWIKQPLLNIEKINQRLDAVEAFLSNSCYEEELHQELRYIQDIERILMKVSTGSAGPRDLVALRVSLKQLPSIKAHLSSMRTPLIDALKEKLQELPELNQLLEHALKDEVPLRVSDGGFIKPGFNNDLDELVGLKTNSQKFLLEYQEELKEKTNIKSLKVGFTRVFGYYIEVSKGQADRMPDSFTRRQTLVNNERFISPELKEFENKILNAEEQISKIETALFNSLKEKVLQFQLELSQIAQAIAHVDVLQSLAHTSSNNRYCRPKFTQDSVLQIKEGRHPVLEMLSLTGQFIPNETVMDNKNQKLFVITGPNMAGKSTYIRQVALIVIMAQMGCYVPASEATLGITDKVFSRIGASDDLSRGQSTFMVEMSETANILNNATSSSLVILDEIGRGTSTYDGISIAWAVAEYLLTTSGKTPKTLFATHYWELTELEKKVKGAVNFSIAVKEWNDEIVFLHKIVRGGADKSYGIQVARLAGLPKAAIKRAKEILNQLEKSRYDDSPSKKTGTSSHKKKREEQFLLFEPSATSSSSANSSLSKIKEQLDDLDVNKVTPMEALGILSSFKSQLDS